MILWFYSKFIEEKRVFNDVEFYLPQLAHMVIHLDVDWNKKSLERFAVLVSEASVHTALQLSFILVAAMEDYQPEGKNGVKNPKGNPTLFFRCARLLQNVERAVIFGMPELSDEEEATLQGKVDQSSKSNKFSAKYNHITHDNILTLVNRIVDTGASVARQHSNQGDTVSDVLLYKRVARKGMFYSKPWKPRYVTVEQRVLIVYHDASAPAPLRTLPLQGCSLLTPEDAKYPFYFEILNVSTGIKFLLRATTEASYAKWIAILKRSEDYYCKVNTMYSSFWLNSRSFSS
jgi:phosphatidylinositol 4-kinase B